MSNVKVVIGSNAGDEGKGLMTDYFANEAKNCNESCIVVCSNGGAQRGHSVSTPEGIRHVFHHFGSGTFAGADTYFPEYFIVNPMEFRREHKLLKTICGSRKLCPIVSKYCMVTTPFDMIANQVFEENRGENKHGSCGMGIWETVQRYEKGKWSALYGNYKYWQDGFNLGIRSVDELLRIKEYYEKRFESHNISLSEGWQNVWNSPNLINHYIHDMRYFLNHTISKDLADFIGCYNTVIFENAQGLCLDQNFGDDERYTTPSNTGLTNPAEIIKKYLPNADVEVCYVTRTYLTRHGRGPMDHECDKNEINPDMFDLTNIPNPFQESLRFGKIKVDRFMNRIYSDFTQAEPNWKRSLAITHLNEYPWEFPEVYENFDNVYESSSCDRNGVIKKRGN